MTGSAAQHVFGPIARAIAPRRPLTVSQWADAERVLSSKGSAEPGRWRTRRNPPLREPMDCMSKRSDVRDVVVVFPIQFGKTEVEVNVLGYNIDHDPGPVMVCLPDELSMAAWIAQKLNPMIDATPAVQRALVTTSRDSANRKAFKDFPGGQLHVEHGKTATRLALKSVRTLLVDEFDKFLLALTGGEDPVELLKGRTSAFPATYKRMFIGSPGIKGVSRLDQLYQESDQRRFYIACPHCGHPQPLQWDGLHWAPDGGEPWYGCRECGACIDEHQKGRLIAEADDRARKGEAGIGWVAENPGAKTRGYHINALYYPIGLGPRWRDLADQFRNAVNDPAKLQVFVCERLAESWEDPAMRAVKHNVIQDRAEPFRLRIAPIGALAITAGVDTQDNRLAVQLVAWGRGLCCWVLDYVELEGDPENESVWLALTDLLNRPIEHAGGGILSIEAVAIDAGGHRTEAVKNFVRGRRVRRPLCIFGAKPNNAPVLSKGKLEDVSWGGKLDKRGVTIHHVGTVAVKHLLYGRLSTDAEKAQEARLVHLPAELAREYFTGLTSEIYNPRKNRFEKKSGARNEPLDTWVYAYAATHHQELRLHRATKADWDAREARLLASVGSQPGAAVDVASRGTSISPPPPRSASSPAPASSGFGSEAWRRRL